MTEFFSKVLNNQKYKKLIIVSGLIGIALIFFSNFIPGEKKEVISKENESLTVDEYRTQIENNLKEIVSSIEGAGNTKVLVTVENSAETVYATEQKKNKESTEDKSNGEITKKKESDGSEVHYITVKDSDGTEKALSVTQVQPTIKGVVIVCDGGSDPCVQQRIIDAVTTALNVTSKRVCVTK